MSKDVNSVQSGFLQTNQVNDPSVKSYTGRNQFPQSFVHPSTCRYGEVDPVAIAKCERGDIYPYKFVTDLNTFTMKSPLKSKVNKYTAAFKVPMQSIYPRNWEIMLPIPNKGDDVPEDTRALFSPAGFIRNALQAYNGLYTNSNSGYQYLVRIVFLLEAIFSDGGIFSKFNMHFCHHLFRPTDTSVGYMCFDDWFDRHFIPVLREYFKAMPATGASHLIFYGDADEGCPDYVVTDDISLLGRRVPGIHNPAFYINFDRAVEILRTGEYLLRNNPDFEDVGHFPQLVLLDDISTHLPSIINIEPIVAYQLACAHFFNNPKIDYVYSAELYRDNMESLLRSIMWNDDNEEPPLKTFEWNGITKLYDVFSGAYLINSIMYKFQGYDQFIPFFELTSFWFNLFTFRRSMRYGDYFVGAHPEPLAVGDINAPVIDGSVNALDMTRKLQMTRLLNKVNITGPRFADYLSGIFGGPLPAADPTSPVRLSLESSEIGGFEVNNTGSAQLSDEDPNITTTNLRLEDSKYMFEAQIDMPCYLIVVQYFDAHRIYSRTFDRFAFHFNRYDDFIPDLQFDGDQSVYTAELDAVNGDIASSFAYNLRYMEYKQRYSYASGGFVRRLPSWAFITDNKDGAPMNVHINPDYIRSSPSEFDRFYKSLNGHSLGTRFHFITFNTNVAAPYRPMVYAPEILA